MISNKQIAAIKMAQRDAGLDNEAYRKLLHETAGVFSCKDLDPGHVHDVLDAIRKSNQNESGWKPRQTSIFMSYARHCGMDQRAARSFLYAETGITHEESPLLTNEMYEEVMMAIEEELESRIHEGRSRAPDKLDIRYWRNRVPGHGSANTRQIYMIRSLFQKLNNYSLNQLPSEYLNGIASKATRRDIIDIQDLSTTDAAKVIDALKSRIRSEQKKIESEVPF